jgi:hypothetical protein
VVQRRRAARIPDPRGEVHILTYRYVGPDEIRAAARNQSAGTPIRSVAGLASADTFTYVVDLGGTLCIAPRHSEHVACAAGADVLAAGEITFARDADGWLVSEVTNQSTGYCPDVTCWAAVAAALDRAAIRRPARFTAAFVFRRCEHCDAISIVKDGDFTCPECDEPLPANWNVATGP